MAELLEFKTLPAAQATPKHAAKTTSPDSWEPRAGPALQRGQHLEGGAERVRPRPPRRLFAGARRTRNRTLAKDGKFHDSAAAARQFAAAQHRLQRHSLQIRLAYPQPGDCVPQRAERTPEYRRPRAAHAHRGPPLRPRLRQRHRFRGIRHKTSTEV